MSNLLNIKVFRLITGEDIVAFCDQKEPNENGVWYVQKPAGIHLVPLDKEGRFGLQLAPWTQFAKTDELIPIPNHALAHLPTTPVEELVNGYNESFGSGIQLLPGSGKLISNLN